MNEFDIIEKYFKHLTDDDESVICGVGDDAAVIDIPPGYELVTSVDTLVNGVHFFADVNPYDLGFKSLAVNLSDMAAMAADPRWITLSLTLPEGDRAWLAGFTEGFSELAKQYSISLVGGDISRGPLSVTVQIMGLIPSGVAIRRSGAQADDLIFVSGCLGSAGYALRHFDNKEKISETALNRLLKPVPRVELGMALRGIASAAIDVSDGLSSDLTHILQMSNKGAVIELEKIPMDQDLIQLTGQESLWQTVLCAGDDYELCFTVPEDKQDELNGKTDELDIELSCIGRVTETKEIQWIFADGNRLDLSGSGYQHF